MKFHCLAFVFICFIGSAISQETYLEIGDNAPNFVLKDSYSNSFKLSDYKGKSPVVLYFYPKANTSGCTKEACGIRDNRNKFKENNIQVFGVSTDAPAEIKKFIEDYDLNFTLLSDYETNVSRKYGVLKDNGTAKRVTFIIDKNGKIAEIFNVTNISTHADDVFEAAIKLN